MTRKVIPYERVSADFKRQNVEIIEKEKAISTKFEF